MPGDTRSMSMDREMVLCAITLRNARKLTFEHIYAKYNPKAPTHKKHLDFSCWSSAKNTLQTLHLAALISIFHYSSDPKPQSNKIKNLYLPKASRLFELILSQQLL